MDILQIAKKEEERRDPSGIDWYAVDPSEMYPAAIGWMKQALAGEVQVPIDVIQDVEAGRLLPPDSWDLALNFSLQSCPRDRHHDRAKALELARRAFTALLRHALGKPYGLHILGPQDAPGAEKFRLPSGY